MPHERATAKEAGDGWVIPDVVVSDLPDAWHPLDMLVAPLYDEHGELRGTLAIDLPLDGRRPGPERRRVLERFAALASRAVLGALERESLIAQAAMASTVKTIVRTTSAQLSLDGLLHASERTLMEGFQASGLWIHTTAEHTTPGTMYSSEGAGVALPSEILDFAETSASYCWHHQVVVTVGTGYPVPPMMESSQFQQMVDLLHGISMSSMVFVPLGAGRECIGSLVLTRAQGERDWTPIESAALLDIGHDLGRAALNARTFEREHALVTELQALDSYKSRLIATVSHELKSPLTTVAGHLEMLESRSISIDGESRFSLQAIGRASARMSRVIEDLLLLRRVGDPLKPRGRESVDLVELLDEAVELTSISAQRKQLAVEVALPNRPVMAIGERDEFDTVLLNIVGNAVKYTPPGRSISISLEALPDVVVLVVRDEGLGISAEDQDAAVHRVLPVHQS